ncbi:MAG: BatD family protein [Gammaproteobacteria bacterium]|nr:BatD family protein [Gammaproteobacteria bacterium]
MVRPSLWGNKPLLLGQFQEISLIIGTMVWPKIIPITYGKLPFLTMLWGLLLSSGIALAQPNQESPEIEITVDRAELARGETLTYTIRVFDQRQGMQLDLTPLTESFDVLGTRTSSQIRSINGAVESWTDYIITLFPLSEGELEIPSLTVNNLATEPIVITVLNEGPRSNQSGEELFLEIAVNKESVYVQEQLLFTMRLFYTINGIRNPQFTELEMPDTVIELIGSPNQYEQLIDGQRYGVYEKRYVIFPQRSGSLEIPDILFRGEVTDGSSNFVFRNLNTRRVTAFTDGMTIEVKERPTVVQDSEFWLPVTSLALEETFDRELDGLQIGDPLIRTITVEAKGLDGAMLPPFMDDSIEGTNIYPDPPDIDRTFINGRIVGTRVERATVVATRSGTLEIPEIRIPWWNVDTDRMETAIVPATVLKIADVAGATPSEQMVESSGDIEELLATAPVVDQEMIDAQSEAQTIEISISWVSGLIALALLILLLSFYQLVIMPNMPTIRAFMAGRRRQLVEHYNPANNEPVAFKQLRKACRSGQANEIRKALIIWCNHFLDSSRIASMEDILQQRQVPQLHPFVAAIQSKLFNDGLFDNVESNSLFAMIVKLRKEKAEAERKEKIYLQHALPPLYKR